MPKNLPLDPQPQIKPRPDPIEARLAHIESLANTMDSQFKVPGTSIEVGLDTLIGLIPGIGDTIGLGVSGYIVAHAYQLGVRKRTLTQMLFNIFDRLAHRPRSANR